MRGIALAVLVTASAAGATPQVNAYLDVASRVGPSFFIGPGLSVEVVEQLDLGVYFGGRVYAQLLGPWLLPRSTASREADLTFAVEALGGYARMLGPWLQLRAGLQLGAAGAYVGGTYRYAEASVSVSRFTARFAAHLALGASAYLTPHFALALLVNVPLYQFLPEVVDGATAPLLGVGATWRF